MNKGKSPRISRKQNEISIVRSSAAEYLAFVATIGDSKASVEMRYEDENIWLTQNMIFIVPTPRSGVEIISDLGFMR